MKKILASVLALCLALSLSVAIFADGSIVLPSYPLPSDPSVGQSAAAGKLIYSAVDANGLPVDVTVVKIEDGVAEEVKEYGNVIGVYYVNVNTPNAGTVVLDVYAPGVADGDTVLIRDAWEVLEGANLNPVGNRAQFTVDADLANQYHYFAIISGTVTIDTPQEPGETDDEEENVEDGDDINVGDEEPETTAPVDANPGTGIALAVVPMIVAAAAVVVSKKR